MKKLLCIVHHRYNRSPGQRFRIEQFIPNLEKNGWQITYSNIISEKDDKVFYAKGKYTAKFMIMIRSFFRRLNDLRKANQYDAVFIYREAYMLGTTFIEKRLSKKNIPFIFDFDDSIWLNDTSAGNKNLKWLKNPSKTAKICNYASLVTVGNDYLANYSKQFNDKVKVIPTVVNPEYHKPPRKTKENDKICIGWTGTETTLKHFETSVPYLKKLYKKYGNKIYFRVIVNFTYKRDDIPLEVIQWDKDNEIEILSETDIGIMPLPDNNWTRGKCGFKGLQYMSLEIPTIMSPVGVNNKIINHGKNGFLAENEKDWINCLSQLIESESLRKKIGKHGRETVINKYSNEVWQDEFLNLLERL